MKLKSFNIRNYKSIQDTGDVQLCRGRIATLAGQNESGKSSILEAVRDFEELNFSEDSIPFGSEQSTQEINCVFELEKTDGDFWEQFESSLAESLKVSHEQAGDFLDTSKIKKAIKEFGVSESMDRDKKQFSISVNKDICQIINASVLEKETTTEVQKEDGTTETKTEKQRIIDLSDKNVEIADTLLANTPKIVLFNDFCDLLPDKFSIADLKTKNTEAKGYTAVKNFEKIAKADFVKLYEMDDLNRDATEEKHNETISVDFTKVWKQRIHADNKIKIAYKFEKRESEENSFVLFYVETKDKQKIRPRMRSKGLIWFLSFWMELMASGADNKLIILADEPGLYLHIRAQEDILAVFEELAKQGHQIIYSTHSPNLIETNHLERINLVINDQTKGTIVESITTSKIDSKNKQDALQPIANAIGFSVSDLALTNKKNVLLEGVSDYFYYMGMRKLLQQNSHYSMIPGIGVRKQNTLISFCLGYGLDWVAIFDDDATRGKDSQKKFQEIKDELFDGDDQEAQKKLYITKGISSVENMFTLSDAKLVDDGLQSKFDVAATIGEKRKVVFSKSFYEKIENGEIAKSKLSKTAIDNFTKVFEWIETQLSL